MLVALDVGNSNVAFGIVEELDVRVAGYAPTPRADMADVLGSIVDDLLARNPKDVAVRGEVVAASVVPAASVALREVAAQRDVPLILADSTNVPIPIRVDHPTGVGNDRLVNAFAAARLYGTPAIVVDLGTATTFDVVAADGAFVGGAIAAGVGLGVEALAAHTAQLPRVPLRMPSRAIGRDTVSAMQSGALIGHFGLIAELVRAISAELALDGPSAPRVILTGGLSNSDWATAIPGVDVIDAQLTLRGLALLHAEIAARATT